jgi:cobalt-zinc-cadmium efflux system membrane fusion protein
MKRIVMLTALALGAACGKKAEDEKKPQAEVVATVEAVTSARFTETVDATGAVTPRMGHVAALNAPGLARVTKVYVTVGATVKMGDTLVAFEQAPFEAAQLSAEASLSAAEKGAERAKRLADAGVSPRKDAETAATELAVARVNAVNARRARELSVLRAPIAGVVTRMSAVLGSSADAGSPLVEVADPSALDVVLTLSPADAARVRVGQVVSLYAGAAAEGDPVASGRIGDVSAAVDTASRGVATRVVVTGARRALRIGETLFGRVAVAEHASAVLVPNDALVPTGEGFKVFVVDEGNVAHAREVKVGARSDRGVWVAEGLKAGERIVTKGAYGVDDSTKVVTGAKPAAKP